MCPPAWFPGALSRIGGLTWNRAAPRPASTTVRIKTGFRSPRVRTRTTSAAPVRLATAGGKLALSGRRSIRALLAGRLGVTVTGRRPRSKVSVRVLRGTTVIATGAARADATGRAKVRLRATRAGRRALRRARSAKLTLSAGGLNQTLRFAR